MDGWFKLEIDHGIAMCKELFVSVNLKGRGYFLTAFSSIQTSFCDTLLRNLMFRGLLSYLSPIQNMCVALRYYSVPLLAWGNFLNIEKCNKNIDNAKECTLSIRLLDAKKEKHQVSWFGVFFLFNSFGIALMACMIGRLKFYPLLVYTF